MIIIIITTIIKILIIIILTITLPLTQLISITFYTHLLTKKIHVPPKPFSFFNTDSFYSAALPLIIPTDFFLNLIPCVKDISTDICSIICAILQPLLTYP